MTLDELVRDLTKVHPQAKSYVRKLIKEFMIAKFEELINEIPDVWVDKQKNACSIEGLKYQLKTKWLNK